MKTSAYYKSEFRDLPLATNTRCIPHKNSTTISPCVECNDRLWVQGLEFYNDYASIYEQIP